MDIKIKMKKSNQELEWLVKTITNENRLFSPYYNKEEGNYSYTTYDNCTEKDVLGSTEKLIHRIYFLVPKQAINALTVLALDSKNWQSSIRYKGQYVVDKGGYHDCSVWNDPEHGRWNCKLELSLDLNNLEIPLFKIDNWKLGKQIVKK